MTIRSSWFKVQRTLWALLICCCVCNVSAQTPEDSTVVDTSTRFSARQLILPASLMTVGTFGVYNGWFKHMKRDLKEDFADWRDGNYCHIDDKLQYLPVVANLGLGLTGLKARHSLKERVAITATSYLALGLTVNVVKHTVREKRPDSDKRNSFPSGHTSTAFMGAELVRADYGTVPGICAYTVASGIAVLRLYNERHWLNDVIAGAGVGILCARVGYWLLPAERKLFGWSNKETTTVVIPTYQPDTQTLGLALSMAF